MEVLDGCLLHVDCPFLGLTDEQLYTLLVLAGLGSSAFAIYTVLHIAKERS